MRCLRVVNGRQSHHWLVGRWTGHGYQNEHFWSGAGQLPEGAAARVSTAGAGRQCYSASIKKMHNALAHTPVALIYAGTSPRSWAASRRRSSSRRSSTTRRASSGASRSRWIPPAQPPAPRRSRCGAGEAVRLHPGIVCAPPPFYASLPQCHGLICGLSVVTAGRPAIQERQWTL